MGERPTPRDQFRCERELLQRKYPVIEFDDGSIHREESKQMAEKTRAGKRFEGRQRASRASIS
jgi:hypothetical protein